jgi:hypothetical protein
MNKNNNDKKSNRFDCLLLRMPFPPFFYIVLIKKSKQAFSE